MKMGHNRFSKGAWFVLVVAVVVGVHFGLFYFVKGAVPRTHISGTILAGALVLLAAKHLGLLAALFRQFRRRSRT